MKPETKKDIKQTVGDLLITAVLIAIFVPLNKKCTHNKSDSDVNQKIEQTKIQQPKTNILYRNKEKTR
ncbi:MAG: hypothetical protein IKF41_02040 [Alphaproteobacteria bacterium]|nr:hypothetical protein [Alphaproteobacteria bacterium]